MDDHHRRLLSRHRSELVRDIVNVEPLLDVLVSKGVFEANGDDIQDIRAQETPHDRARSLLDLLQSRGPNAYQHFLNALRSVRPHLALLLEQLLDVKLSAPSPEPTNSKCLHSSSPEESTVRKLQRALRDHYRELARSTTLLDHQTLDTSVGLDKVFVTLSALHFHEIQSLFARRKKLTSQQIQQLASKTWCDRRTGEEITDLTRLLRFPNGQSAKSCLLLGQAASGKTLTLYKLLSIWAEESEGFLEDFEFVFYVSGRDKHALEAKNAVDVLQLHNFAGLEKTPEKISQLASYLDENSEKVLILLDSVDEGGEKWGSNEGIQQILQRRALGRCSFVATGRPCLTAYQLIPRCVQHFHLAGLNDYHLEELLRRRLGDEQGQALDAQLRKAEWTTLRALMKETPLLANMVAVLAKNCLSLPKTRTEVYTTMLLNLVTRSQTKVDSSVSISRDLRDLPKEVKESLLQVSKVAVEGLRRGQFVFDAKKDIGTVCSDAAQRLGLVEEFRTVSVFGDTHEVHFCHLTWQEYLAAYYVSEAEDVEKELLVFREEIGLGEETLPFWRFVAGLLGVKKLKGFMRVLCRQVRQSREPYAWRWLVFKMSCLAEAVQQQCSSPELVETRVTEVRKAAAISLPKQVDFSNCEFSENEMQSISVALSCAPCVTEVNLGSCNLGLAHLRILNAAGGLQHLERLDCSMNNLHGDSLVELRKGLRCNRLLHTLLLVYCGLDESECNVLCQVLNTNRCLQGLSLGGNPIGTSGHEILWPAVCNSQLRWLNLDWTANLAARRSGSQSHESIRFGQYMRKVYMSHNNLSTEYAESIVRATQESLCMSLLDLSHNRIENRIVNVIAAVFQHRAQQPPTPYSAAGHPQGAMTVRLHENEVEKHVLERLSTEMPVGSRDRVECGMLVVSGGKIIRPDLSVYFDKYTQQGGKGELWMNHEGIDESGAQQVAERLNNDRVPVETLTLLGNSVGDKGTASLASALSTNSTLRALSLCANNVSSLGFAALCNTLVETNSTLQLLNIGTNPIFASKEESISSDAREQLGILLRASRGLKFISLAMTGLGDVECTEMANSLVENTSHVQFLHLRGNHISDVGAAALFRGLEKNTTVRFLDMSDNPFGEDGLSAVFRCVEARSKSPHPLERVWIGEMSTDVSHFAGIVIRAGFSSSLTSALDTYCAS